METNLLQDVFVVLQSFAKGVVSNETQRKKLEIKKSRKEKLQRHNDILML